MKKEIKNTLISFEVPESFLLSMNQTQEEFTEKVLLTISIELFRTHKLSFGKASELSRLSKELFKLELFRRDISIINYSPDDLEKEIEDLNRINSNWNSRCTT
jgi:predicted HTH domain antitoxin